MPKPFQTTLSNAIESTLTSGGKIICDNYEIDAFVDEEDGSIRLDMGDDISVAVLDQNITIDAKGHATSTAMYEHLDDVKLEFYASSPLREEDLLVCDDAPAPALNQAQTICLKHYACGEFAHFADLSTRAEFKAALKDCGDGLLRFLMVELDDAEDCTSVQEAMDRVNAAIEDLQAVQVHLEDGLADDRVPAPLTPTPMG